MIHSLASHRIWHRPHSAMLAFLRFVVGGIWLAGAAFNAFVTWSMSEPYAWLADDARTAPWRWFFRDVVAQQPEVWTALLIAGELTLGGLTLSRGRWAQAGLIGGVLFSVMLFSFGTAYTLMMGPYALLLYWLYRHDDRHSVLDLFHHHRLSS